MIREIGTVIAVNGRSVEIDTQLKSGCSGCSKQNTCGAGLLSKAFPGRRGHFSVMTDEPLSPGQDVELQLPEEALTRFSLAVYMLPLLALFAGALFGQWWFAGHEGGSIGLGFAAFAFSFYLLRRYLRHKDVKVQALLQVRGLSTTP